MNRYIDENGKSSMGAVVEQIQQTYDLQVNRYYSQLHLVEDYLLQEKELSLETDTHKKIFEAWEKESESTLLFLQENGKAITVDGKIILQNWLTGIMKKHKAAVIWLQFHVRNIALMEKLIRQSEPYMIMQN